MDLHITLREVGIFGAGFALCFVGRYAWDHGVNRVLRGMFSHFGW